MSGAGGSGERACGRHKAPTAAGREDGASSPTGGIHQPDGGAQRRYSVMRYSAAARTLRMRKAMVHSTAESTGKVSSSVIPRRAQGLLVKRVLLSIARNIQR